MSLDYYTTEELVDEIRLRMGRRTMSTFTAQRELGVSRLVLNKLTKENGLPHFTSYLTGVRVDPEETIAWLKANRPELLG